MFTFIWLITGYFSGVLCMKIAAAMDSNRGRFDFPTFYEYRTKDFLIGLLLAPMGLITFGALLLMIVVETTSHLNYVKKAKAGIESLGKKTN